MSQCFPVKFFLLLFAMATASVSVVAQQMQEIIQNGLQAAKEQHKLTARDISEWGISDQYSDKKTGITHTYIQQEISGIRIFNAVSSMAIRDGKVLSFANRFYADATAMTTGTSPALQPEQAIKAALEHLGIQSINRPSLKAENQAQHQYTFLQADVSRKPIEVSLYYVLLENTLRLGWNVTIAPLNSPDWWNIRIDAKDGSFLEKNNWTLHCDFDSPATSELLQPATGSPLETAGKLPAGNGTASYRVFEFPLEAPNFGPRTVQVDPGSPEASPFGWHDIDGMVGPEYTITRGNNVHAYDDRNNQDSPGYSPDGGASLNFDFPLDPNQQPIVNQDAIITNLFYVNNMLHDILHLHGFDEAAGNFQQTNYSNDGAGNDYVNAEAQDGGGTNNANFSTPNDGNNGTMQMYLWTNSAPSDMLVNGPASVAGTYTAVEAGFGPGLLSPITSDIVLVNDGVDPTTDGCESIVNGAAISGKIAVVDRGQCTFLVKVAAAEASGAIAVIVINNSAGAPTTMGGTGNVNIPSVMISKADGDLLKAQLNAGNAVNVTLKPPSSNNVDLDGSLDNGIVSHEYGHGLSNRLTGGPGNSNCLSNGEQGGEGWSDWLALIMTIKSGDVGSKSRGIGTYATGQATTGSGIRRYPYSTDMAVNPQTYGDLAFSTGVHNVGEIWCQVLWDMTWKLIEAEGFNPDWLNGTAGNNTAMNLVIEGMKLQACGPSFLDARDGILKADEMLYNNAHRCLIWKAFAGRGMGFSASAGSAGVAGDESPAFDLPSICQIATAPPIANFVSDTTTSCFGIFHFTDKSTATPQTWLWNFGDGNTSTETSPSHVYAVAGTFPVTLIVGNTLGADTFSLSVTYLPPAVPMISGTTTVCAGSSTTLQAISAPGNIVEWRENGNLVYTGPAFQTPTLTANTSYSVQQLEEKPVLHGGPVDNTLGGGGNHNTGFDGRLLFEAYAPFKLLSVLVYAQGAASRTFSLYDGTGAVVQEVTVNVPDGASRVTLNMEIPAAGLYSLGNISQNLYRNNAGTGYPYTVPNLLRIYSSNATGSNALIFYYYFYDWEIQETGCASIPSGVMVNVLPVPVANFNVTTNGLTASFSDGSIGNSSSWAWNFGDGTTVSTLQNPSHNYASSGTYTVVLTVSNGSCNATYQQEVTVALASGTQNLDNSYGLKLYPNPANDQLHLEFEKAPAAALLLQLFDADGRECYTEKFARPNRKISIQTAALPSGVYKLQLSGDAGVMVRKVVVVKQ